MNLPYLVIDTSSQNINVAIFDNKDCLNKLNANNFADMPSTYIVPEIVKLLQNNNIDFTALKFVAVVNGPGYFTSLRLGLTYAKILHLSLNIPIVTVNTLDCLATEGIINNSPTYIIATFNIGKEGAVIGIYNHNLQLIKDQFYINSNEIEKIENITLLQGNGKILVLGNKQDMVQSPYLNLLYKPDIQYPNVDIVANLALRKYNNRDFAEHLNTIYIGS